MWRHLLASSSRRRGWLCPFMVVVVVLLLVYHCHAHVPHRDEGSCSDGNDSGWTHAFLATAIISIFPTLVLPFIPLTKGGKDGAITINMGLQKVLLSFAAGGLLGEVFLHCIPHLLEQSHDHDDHHHHQADDDHHDDHHHHKDTLMVSIWIVAGFLVFFLAEKGVKLVLGEEGEEGGHGHHHHHHHGNHHQDNGSKGKKAVVKEVDHSNGGRMVTRSRTRSQQKRQVEEEEEEDTSTTTTTPTPSTSSSSSSSALASLRASGYLNIVVDLLHNFTDGIAIGTSYATGHGMGLATTLSVFFHEVPHEIGDFAILVQSGLRYGENEEEKYYYYYHYHYQEEEKYWCCDYLMLLLLKNMRRRRRRRRMVDLGANTTANTTTTSRTTTMLSHHHPTTTTM